jgi:transposase
MCVPSCQGCRERDARIARLEAELAELKATVRDLQARLKLDATNSSLPPAANPPQGRTPVVKPKSPRPRGGQPGHAAQLRHRLPPERVQQVVPFVPEHCGRCGEHLPAAAGPNDPEPSWHQYVQLPPLAAHVIEYQGHGRTCLHCGHLTRATIPDELRQHTFAPDLTAAVAYLTGAQHLSRRAAEEVIETFFGVPIALGTVSNLEQQAAAALAPAHAEAQQEVQQANVKNVDETSWKQAGQKRWLWVGATARAACFVITLGRGLPGLLTLLGQKRQGILCSDRWSVYGCWRTERRQVCWAHLKRDFQKLVDRGGAAKKYGRYGLALVGIVFYEWHLFRGGGSRAQLQWELEPFRESLREQLGRGARCRDRPTAALCQNLLAVEPALWTFLYEAGVEPTNNHAERMLRRGVLWRKNAFGSQSDGGCRFVERMLTVVQTLRLQHRPVFAYLTEAIAAHRTGSPIPKLLPQA